MLISIISQGLIWAVLGFLSTGRSSSRDSYYQGSSPFIGNLGSHWCRLFGRASDRPSLHQGEDSDFIVRDLSDDLL